MEDQNTDLPSPAEAPEDAHVHLSRSAWKALGSGGVVFGLACLAGVIAVLALEGEALATAALVLAVIAFVIQILMFVVQTNAASAADRRAQRTYDKTQSLLREMRAKAEANEAILLSHFDRMLTALLRSDGKDGAGDADEEEAQSEAETKEQPVARDIEPLSWRDIERRAAGPSDEDRRIIERIYTWPSPDEAPDLVEQLRSLPPAAVALLDRYVKSELGQRRAGRRVGLGPSADRGPERQALIAQGLVREVDPGRPLFALTDRGRDVARLLRGKGQRPDHVADLLARPLDDSGAAVG